MQQTQYKMDKSLFNIDLSELYVETKPFSRGAYSKVYKAKYKDAKVCVKVISKALEPDDPSFFEYVEREMLILRSLSHPNVLTYYGAAEDDEDFYIVTEYVAGGNIRQYLQSQQELDWDLKIHIAVGIAQGLNYLHANNVIHRDIKSENFLVGDGWQVKLCDFGFARKIESLGRKRSMSICGTEEYMSPEMLVGLDYCEKVDVFSYGIFLAELLTQCYLPFDFKRTAATQFGIDLLKLKELTPEDCPIPLLDIVIDCCDFAPSSRPDFEKIIHRLEDIRETLPHFDLRPPCTYEYFEKITVPSTTALNDTVKKRSRAGSRAVVQEIKYKEYSVDDAAARAAAAVAVEIPIAFEEIEFKEIQLEEEYQFEEIKFKEVKIEPEMEEEEIEDDLIITPFFNSFSSQKSVDRIQNPYKHVADELRHPTRRRSSYQDSSISDLDPDTSDPIDLTPDPENENEDEDMNNNDVYSGDYSGDSQDQDLDPSEYLQMEDVNVVNLKVIEIPEIPELTSSDYDNSLVAKNEKYSYYYN